MLHYPRARASTEAYDRGAKFDHYQRLESLRECVLVSTDRFAVDPFAREPDGSWRFKAARGLEAVLHLTSADVSIPLAEIYENIDVVAREAMEEASPHPPAADAPRR